MPFFAANGVPVVSDYKPASTFPVQGVFQRRWRQLDCFSNGTDVIFQPLEEEGGWPTDEEHEGLLPMGFNSVNFLTPFIAVRFKVWQNTLLAPAGTIHIRLLA